MQYLIIWKRENIHDIYITQKYFVETHAIISHAIITCTYIHKMCNLKLKQHKTVYFS